jgi:uracil phosphoribosyltransferase
MLATANSAVARSSRLKERGRADLRFVCLLAAPEGIERCAARTPTSNLDRRRGQPPQRPRLHRAGLGDAGDRMYGTR